MSANRSRQPKGTPTGGEFSANTHDEASSLDVVTPGVWNDRARELFLGKQKYALAVSLSHAFGGGGKVCVKWQDADPDRAEAIFAETSSGHVVNADGWHNRIDALGIEYPYSQSEMEPTPEDWIDYEDTLDQDYDLASSFASHFAEQRPPEDPEPWFGNYERDRRYESGFDARASGNAGTVYDPRILDERRRE